MREPPIRALGVLGMTNILLGALAALSAVFNFTFYLLRTVEDLQRCLVDGSLASVTAILGIASGATLLKRKSVSRWICLTFAVVLMSVVIASAFDGEFDAVVHPLLALYSLLLIVLAGMPIWTNFSAGDNNDAVQSPQSAASSTSTAPSSPENKR